MAQSCLRQSCCLGADPSAVWLLTLLFLFLFLFFVGVLSHWCSWSVYIMCGCVPVFLTMYPAADQTCSVTRTWVPCGMALGDFHSRIQSPTVAMYPILCQYNSTGTQGQQLPRGRYACAVWRDYNTSKPGMPLLLSLAFLGFNNGSEDTGYLHVPLCSGMDGEGI
jgi:hypothetical protein